MADNIIKRFIDLIVRSDGAVKDIDKATDALDNMDKSAVNVNHTITDIGDNAKTQKKAVKGLGGAVKSVGVALKALGIGLIIAAVAGLTEAFTRNKRVMDFVSITLGTIQEVFSQVANALVETYDAVTKSSDNFDALGKVLGGLITLQLTPLKALFFGIKLGIQEAQLVWEKSPFGNGDQSVINDLNLAILETKNNLYEVGVAAVQAGKDVVTNFVEAAGEVGDIGGILVENLSKVSGTLARDTAKAYKASTDAAIIAAAQAAKTSAELERQAAEQRKIRDNVNLGIGERQAANEKLLEILNKQETALLAGAKAAEASAAAELAKEDSAENVAALISAQAATEQVRADIAAKGEETETNRVALLNEEKQLQIDLLESEDARRLAQLEFEASLETDPLKKIELQKEALALENELLIADYEFKKTLYDEDTQARLDADIAYEDRKQEIENERKALEEEKKQEEYELRQEQIQLDLENEEVSFQEKLALLEEREQLITDNTSISEEERTKQIRENVEARKQLNKAELDSKLDVLGKIGDAFGTLSDIAGKETAAGKALAVVGATIDTIKGGVSAFTGMVDSIPGPVGIALGVVAAAGVVASGFASVKKILAVKVPGQGGGGGGAAPPAVPQAQFNLVGQSNSNQIADAIGGQTDDLNANPIQAFVVSDEVTSQQSLDRNRLNNATFL
jgi:hypothetical protein